MSSAKRKFPVVESSLGSVFVRVVSYGRKRPVVFVMRRLVNKEVRKDGGNAKEKISGDT